MNESVGTDRVALITGAAGGIGRASVDAFLGDGWRVIAVDRAAVEFPNEVAFHQVDLRQVEAVAALFEELRQAPGRLDVLVNNAAVQINKPIEATDITEWDEVLEINLRAAFLMAKHSLEWLSVGQGSIVNVSSVHALATSKHIAAYAASKGGLVALTRAMAIEFGERGVRVNAVVPGAVDTAMLQASSERLEGSSADEQLRGLAKRTPLGRIGEPHEIAQAILFLADGARSSFITGQALVVDGGVTARLATE